jgi:hypothetical protein
MVAEVPGKVASKWWKMIDSLPLAMTLMSRKGETGWPQGAKMPRTEWAFRGIFPGNHFTKLTLWQEGYAPDLRGGDSDQGKDGCAAVWMDVVGGCPASDGDYRMIEEVGRIGKLRRIELDVTVNDMGSSQAESLIA